MKNRQISGAFDRWSEMTKEAKEMRVKLTRFMKKMLNSQLIGAYERWAEMAREQKEMRVKLTR